MPVYEYKCGSCGEKFEVIRSLKDEETEVKCPGCGASDTRLVYSLFGRGCISRFMLADAEEVWLRLKWVKPLASP